MIKAYGGRKTRNVKITVSKNQNLQKPPSGMEGKIRIVNLELQRRQKNGTIKTRNVNAVEKEFHQMGEMLHLRRKEQPHFQRPLKQWKLYNELKELNRKEKLGLPLIPMMRIVRNKSGIPKLILTKINEAHPASFNVEEVKELLKEIRKHSKTLEEKGYEPREDMWIYDRDPKTNKPRAWIVDFGNITRKKLSPKNTSNDVSKWFGGVRERIKNRKG